MKKVYLDKPVTCDLCNSLASYDSKTKMGPSAYLCKACFTKCGVPPTTELLLRNSANAEKVVKVSFDSTVREEALADGYCTLICPECRASVYSELDSNYVYCPACSAKLEFTPII